MTIKPNSNQSAHFPATDYRYGSSASVLNGELAGRGATAVSQARVIGANSRILLGHVGIGNRGSGLQWITAKLKDSKNVEMAAVCDLWKTNREKAAANTQKYYGRASRAFSHLEDMLAVKELDGIFVSTPEHQHSPMLTMVIEAGKHCYVEKPMGNVLTEAKAARTPQCRVTSLSRSAPNGVASLSSRGAEMVSLGDLRRSEQGRGGLELPWSTLARTAGSAADSPGRYRLRPWLMTKPDRPFDPRLYFEYRLYREFSSGIPDQWMSHAIDLVAWFMDDPFPVSVVAHGGVSPGTMGAKIRIPSRRCWSIPRDFW
jgi:hypothetical protein